MRKQSTEGQESSIQRARALWREYLLPYKGTLVWAVVGGIVAAVSSGFGIPVILQEMFPVIFDGKPLPPWAERVLLWYVSPENLPLVTVWATAAMLPLVVVVRGLSSFVNVYLLSKIGLGVLETLRLKVYRKYQDLSLAFHDRQQKGDLLSRLMQDTQFLQGGLVQIANDLIIQPLTLLAALGFLIYRASVSEQFLILLANMLLVGVCVIPIRYIGRKMLARARVVQSSQGDLSSTLQENFSSQRDIRAFELEQQQIRLFRDRIRRYIQASIGAVRWQSLLTPLIEFVSAIAMAATLLVGNMNGMNMGDFAALATAMYLCYEPVKKLGAVHNKAETLNAGLERINHVLNAPDDVPEPENPRSPAAWKGEVEFRNVCFGYQQDSPVMRNIDLRIPSGQVVALVGPSGAGKTTFINLLCRFYDVLSGSVKVDGIDVPMDMYFYNLCYAASYMESYMNMYGMDLDWSMELQEGETVLDVTKDSILENTKSFAVIEKLAQENNVILDEAALSELEAERAETVESLGGEESYRAELAKLGLSEETYDRMCRSDYLYSALEELAATEGSSLYATDEQLIAYAAEQGYMTADHILLLTRDMSTYQELDDETKAEKKALAEELKAKLDAYTGDDLIGYFTELADEYSEDSGRAGNPEGYTFGSGQMVEEFESAAAALGEGEVSEIVESYYGYHIILRKPLDEAKAVDAVRETYFSGLLESRIEDAAVEMNPAVEALDLVDIYDAFSLLMDTDADGDTADDTATENGQEAAES